MTVKRLLHGWGRTAATSADVADGRRLDDLRAALSSPPTRGVAARGLGRSYGDAAQNAGGLVFDMTGADRILEVDTRAHTATVDAGVSLDALLRHVTPLGLWVPVLPGTRQVTVGGAIACDVHGKNHHAHGSFGDHVVAMDLVVPGGDLLHLTPDGEQAELFWATVGGLGLTGIVTRATLRLRPVETSSFVVDTHTEPALMPLMEALSVADRDWPYTVAWFDTAARGTRLGRGIVMVGDHAGIDALAAERGAEALRIPAGRGAAVPLTPPIGFVTPGTARVFNRLWFAKAPTRRRGEIQDVTTFMHPLDGVRDWNRLYGPRGFCQYQCVVPDESSAAITAMIERISDSGQVSALTVLKRFGTANRAPLSFPRPGWTLAVDFPVRRGLDALLRDLDALTLAAGGRLYLAKDSRMRAGHLSAMYPRLGEFAAVRDRVDPGRTLTSDLARRLEL